MPTARENLLETAHAAVSARPWAGVRMVELAASAGVSRQTLYNEFGNKDGLGSALVGHRVERFLQGAAAVAAQAACRGADPPAALAVSIGWMLRTVRGEPIVRCALTGCWSPRMPLSARGVPGTPAELAAELRHRLVTALTTGEGTAGARTAAGEPLHRACEAALRLALSYLIVPEHGAEDETCRRIQEIVRALL